VAAPRTLPWSWYSDPEVLRREQERIFRRSWQYVGHAGQVEDVGDRVAAWAGDVPVLVVRDEEGIRAFVNVCRHRGSLLAEGPGKGKTIQCPYHAWTYELDGSLRAAPRSEREEGFEAEGLSLVPMRLETWGPFLFVNPDADAPPLAETLGPVPDFVPVDGLVFHSRDEYELAANWKIGCENYLECYHCPVAHKGFSAAYDVDPDEYRLEPTGEHVLSQFAHTRDGEEGQGQFHFVWPNIKINVLAGTPNLSIGPLLPAGPERASGFLDYFFAPGADKDWVEVLLAFDRQVGAEDRVLVERVQKGVRSGIVEEGRLLGESEQLVARFQELVGTALS
jgi:phenylpropionate dioxygenase-like ring-hydroxylating dioxygenase large terminal subunit